MYNTGYEASLPSSLLWHEWALCATCAGKDLFLQCVLSLQALGPGMCVDLARQPSSLEEPHTGASALLCMAPFPQLLPHCEDLGPTPKRPSASATLLFSNAQTMCTTDILNCTMMISCFILHVIYWAFGVVGWWTFFRRRQWNCAMMVSSFNLLWPLLFALVLWWQCHYILPIRFCMCCFVFRYSLHFVRLSLSIGPLSVMSSHDLLAVLLLTTPHSQWCIYFYPSLSTFLQNPLSCRSETTGTKVMWIS